MKKFNLSAFGLLITLFFSVGCQHLEQQQKKRPPAEISDSLAPAEIAQPWTPGGKVVSPEPIKMGCTHADKKLFTAAFSKGIEECTEGIPDQESAKACLKKKFTISDPCAECFGMMVECAKDMCMGKCIFDRDSAGCHSCIEHECRNPAPSKKARFSLTLCTGVPEHELPKMIN